MPFTGSKITFLAVAIEFQNLENTGYHSTRKNFKRDFPKMDIFGISKSISSHSFRDKRPKPGSYAPGTKTKGPTEPIPDPGIKSENIEL